MELEFGGKRYPITAGENAIGSARACTIVVTGDGIRSRHAMLHHSPVGVAIRALAPDAAVLLNGAPVGGDLRVVRHGDRITIGRHELLVVDAEPDEVGVPAGVVAAEAASTEAASTMVAPSGATYRLADTMHGMPAAAWRSVAGGAPGSPESPAAPVAMAAPLPASFLVRAGEQKGHRLPVRRTSATVGRAEYNDVVVRDPSVSAEHARLWRRDGLWILADAGSTNGTYVDGERVTEETPLMPGATVRLGEVTLLFEPYDEPAADRASAAAESPARISAPAPALAAKPARPGAGAKSEPEPSHGMWGWLIAAVVVAAAAGAAIGSVLLR